MNLSDFVKERNKADIKTWSKCSDLQDGILMLYYTLYTKGQVGLKEVNKQIKKLLEIEIEISRINL
jgi:hypothetical protein